VNTGALLNRLNFSLTLAGNKIRGSRTMLTPLLGVDAGSEPRVALTARHRGFPRWLGRTTTFRDAREQWTIPRWCKPNSTIHQSKRPRCRHRPGFGPPEFQRR